MVNPGGEPFGYDAGLTPFLQAIHDALDNIDVRVVLAKGNTRSAKTVAAENMILRDMTYGPLKNVLWFMQDEDSLNDYIDERGEQMLEIHEEVKERIDWKDSRNKSRTRKRIGRALMLWRAATSRALRAKAAPTIVADEIDAYVKKVRDAIMTLVTSRQEEFGTAAKAYLCSHPDAGPDGGIDLLLQDALLHLWFAQCPECGHAASPAREAEEQDRPRWKWNVPDLMGLADEMERVAFLDHVAANVHLICPNPKCRATFGPDRRLEIMNSGRWLQPHQVWLPNSRIKGEPRVAPTMGFVIHAFMAPFVKMQETARDWAAAMLTYQTTGNDVHLREVVVKKLGETPMGASPEEQVDPWKVVQARLSTHYPLKCVPPGVMFMTAFVDVQGDRFEVVVIGWSLARESWLIDRYAIKQWPAIGSRGAFDNISPAARLADWDVIEEAVIAASYPLQANPQRVAAGLEELFMPIAKTVVNNSGSPGVTNNGRKWLANMLIRREGRRVETWQVMLMQGMAKGETYGGRSKPVEFDDAGKALPIPVFERYPNVSQVKRIIAMRMKIEQPGAGRMHLPSDTERKYWVELTSERLTNDEWVKTHRFNETWDGWVACEVGREALKADNPKMWAGKLPIWAEPKPRGQGLGNVIFAPSNVFDRLAQVNADV
jgi:phage terminase large subunit GpA-like protein